MLSFRCRYVGRKRVLVEKNEEVGLPGVDLRELGDGGMRSGLERVECGSRRGWSLPG